jgi:hypothetical protein
LLDRIIHHHHENQEKKDQKENQPNEGRHDQPSKESELGKLKNYLQGDEAKLKDYLREARGGGQNLRRLDVI